MQTHYRAVIGAALINFSYILSSFITPVYAQPAYASPAEIPAEAFAALPSFSDAQLSPNGKSLAYGVNLNGRRHIVYQNLDGSDKGIIPPTEKDEIARFSWANDTVLLVQIGSLQTRREFLGKTYNTRYFSFNRKNGKFIWLGKPKKRKGAVSATTSVSQLERIVDRLNQDPKNILMQFDFNLDGNPEVFRVNVFNGRRKMIRPARRGIQNWYTDHTSTIRAGTGYDRKTWQLVIKGADGEWANTKNSDWAQKYNLEGFSPDPNILYVSGPSEHGTNALYSLNASSGEVIEQIFSHKAVDVDYTVEHPVTGHLIGAHYTDEFPRTEYFDKNLAIVQRSIDKALKGSVNTIVSKAQNEELYLFHVANDRNPGDYYLFHRKKGELAYISPVMNSIDSEKTAKTDLVAIPMQDGNTIPGFLTVPLGKELTNLPTVILPHGGPHARDTAEWDFWAQFYASRGYLVLKPNFRGSTGYGRAFRAKGRHQWGGLMQRDITDATNWLIEQNYSDPDRICIVGASYGGYAALMGIIQEPNLYKCAISVNGVTNLKRLKSNDKNRAIGGSSWTRTMGLRDTPDEEVSPYHLAEKINAPVLLMSSKDDARIPYRMTDLMHERLEDMDKDTQLITIENGGHSMITDAARLKMLKASEEFLAKHLGQ